MKLLYLNPNSTQAMTDSVVEVARAELPGVEVLGWTNADGPPAIEGPEHGAAAVPGLLAMLPAAKEAWVDAIVIACFDDTGLLEIRSASHCPVLGIGQSAYMSALLLGLRFSVVTTLPVSVPVIEGNISMHGADHACMAVRPSGLPVLAVEEGSEETRQHLAREVTEATTQGASAVVLGCAGMANLRSDLVNRTGSTIIDGVAASAHLAAALVQIV